VRCLLKRGGASEMNVEKGREEAEELCASSKVKMETFLQFERHHS
jgi:hypothetical protein